MSPGKTGQHTSIDSVKSNLVTPSPHSDKAQQNPFYMLKKDSERREALASILGEQKEQIVEQWYSLLAKDFGDQIVLQQVSVTGNVSCVTIEPIRAIHFILLIACFLQSMLHSLLDAIRTHVLARDGRKIRLCIDEIRSDLDFDMVSTNQVHAALYLLQEAVSYHCFTVFASVQH